DPKKLLDENLQSGGYDAEVNALMERVSGNMIPYERGEYVLTDDKAPVELLGMRVIDDIIRDEIKIYKDIYDQEGLKGLMEYL
ncbi:MAG: spermidine synthase, partial [Lachnospiraceae bacterium]|nr:spermidine synthase [Lachnospiraceae bacterium]